MVNKHSLVKLLQQLIQINSENPPGNETKIALFVKHYLENLGLKARVYEFKKNRPNILAEFGSKKSGKSLLITPHLDTVPAGIGWKTDPFSGKVIGDKIYGVGATDCKVNLAASLEVIKSLVAKKAGLDYNLIFAATADEESGSALGLIPLLSKGILKADAAVVLDADDFDIVVAQKGLMHLKVKIKGKRAHGAYPDRGVNAIDIAAKIINDLKHQKQVFLRNKHLKPPTINVGVIRGGDKVNIVADWCDFELDFRFLPQTSASELVKNLRLTIKKYTNKFKIEIDSIQQPYLIGEQHSLVRQMCLAMQVNKIPVRIKGSEGATVITFFQHQGIPAIATGFGEGGCAHSINEYARVDNLYKGSLALEQFLKEWKWKV
ncbi:MAG: M20 family metallopeptidase [Candidatus Omnitrophica bacterium]|nr:M20 family metallopeptidase [Candidatus Omnitrophota bacterium]